MEWLLLAIPIAALAALFGPSRGPAWPVRGEVPPGIDDGPDAAGVREPRRPGPDAGSAAVALAPPHDGGP